MTYIVASAGWPHLDHAAKKEIPTTGREAAMLAPILGYTSLAHMIGELPSNARVLDVGAGTSNLGARVALRRPDISWTNLDIAYRMPHIVRGARSHGQAPNLQLVKGDIFAPPSELQGRKFDRIFSYWLLPHFLRSGYAHAAEAIKSMLELTEPEGGQLTVGPVGWIDAIRDNPFVKSAHMEANHYDGSITCVRPPSQEAINGLAAQVVESFVQLPK